MKKILSLYKISLKKQLSYKGNFFIELIVWSIYSLLPLILINLFLRASNLDTIILQFTNLMYGIIYISYNFSRMIARGLDNYSQLLFSGDLDVFFIRPIPILLQVISSSLFLRRLSGIMIGIVAILRSYSNGISIPINFVIFLCITLSIMYIALLMISSSITTVTIKGTMLTNFLVDASANIGFYPTNLLQSPAKEIFTFIIPIYTCLYLPLQLIIKQENLLYIILLPLVSSLITLFIGIVFFNYFLKKYKSANS